MNKRSIGIGVIFCLLGVGVGFLGGYQYRNYILGKQRTGFAVGGTNGQRFVTNRSGNMNTASGFRGGAVVGSVLSIDASSMTVKLQDGSSKIVILGGSTGYSNTTAAASTDIKVGNEVAVFGSPNSDGSVTATNVQINPEFGRLQTVSPAPLAK